MADERCSNVFAYPGPDDCIWMGFSPDHESDLLDPQNRLALLITICEELDVEAWPLGTTAEIPDAVVTAVLDSITGRGPMWWKKKGHKFVKHYAKQGKGFA